MGGRNHAALSISKSGRTSEDEHGTCATEIQEKNVSAAITLAEGRGEEKGGNFALSKKSI